MNIKELYRWPLRGGSFMVLGESAGHELFRGNSYPVTEFADDEETVIAERQAFGGWVPLEGSAEELLALRLLQLRDDLEESQRQAGSLHISMRELEARNRELAAALEELQAQEKPKAKRRSLGRAEDVELPMSLLLSQEFKDAWVEYLEVRRERRWTTSGSWAKKVLEHLNRWPADVSAKALRKASLGPWMSVHPEKEAAPQKTEQPPAPVPPYFNRRSV